MTLATLGDSPMYADTVLRPSPSATSVVYGSFRNEMGNRRNPDQSSKFEWIIPVLTLLGTAGAMWFVVTDGWFQLFGLWAC